MTQSSRERESLLSIFNKPYGFTCPTSRPTIQVNHEVPQTGVEQCARFVGVNFLDVMVRQGLVDHPIKPPFTMGSECAGKVVAVGEDVKQYKVGDSVVVLRETGAWTERLYVPVNEVNAEESATATTTSTSSNRETVCILPWPKKLSASKASILAFAYLPAYILLHKLANVQSGDVLLVHSAGGGVGTAIGQLAKQIPNVKLIGTASKAKHEKLTGLYDVLYTPDEDKVSEIKKLHPEGISVILDCLSGEEISKSYTLLKPLGKYILYGKWTEWLSLDEVMQNVMRLRRDRISDGDTFCERG
ncbi:unnamed protein product [Echinostoma caproni]|uniref:PKS_ER domain-containing protein n=1 Tax=Echinostoma caproni TaxID=27848 RepID=A0A183APZ1_9TREM|nr:unnamed protein product [Echinostoma caproni]